MQLQYQNRIITNYDLSSLAGKYKTDEMIIGEYEIEKSKEREKLMKFVEEAAYASENSTAVKVRRSPTYDNYYITSSQQAFRSGFLVT